MRRSRPIGWLANVIRPTPVPDPVGVDAAGRLIAGDVDGASAAAEIGRTVSSIVRRMRTPDPLLAVRRGREVPAADPTDAPGSR